jgi:competence protein ComEA
MMRIGLLVFALLVASRSARADPPPVLAAQMVDLNQASERDLVSLPGIGPVKAQAILEWRQKNGGFRKVEDLVRVKGFGRKMLHKLRPYLLVKPVDKRPAPS